MTFIQLMLLYFCTVVSVLYLVSGGYKVIRGYLQKKINEAAVRQEQQKVSPQPQDNGNTS
ncbi:DUF1378 family protein [Escherichia coli]|uniref:DUF1378 family protein n=1 Tax=Escherichia coli TaxID=562 RepID=UPI001F0DF82D|nr:DUF1378 family protein [Escherichia coli]UMR99279.1 DUF1378 domain-containing protein [Escherichia coli]